MAVVARAAGGSVTTVSHVINRSRPVSLKTERAVLAAVVRTGYVTRDIARASRQVGARTIGVALSADPAAQFGELVHAIEDEAATHGFTIFLADTHERTTDEIRVVADFLQRGVEAVILAPAGDADEAILLAGRRRVPLVLLDRLLKNAPVDQVGIDNTATTAALVGHLVQSGHQQIAMISGPSSLVRNQERVAGYQDALGGGGISVRADLLRTGRADECAGQSALLSLLGLPEPPSAVVIGSHRLAIGALRATLEQGLAVPDNLALVVLEDVDGADVFRPRLTTMARPTQRLGRQTVQMVVSRLADLDRPERQLVLPTTLQHRDSCGCRHGYRAG